MFIQDTAASFYGRNFKITTDILEKWFEQFQGNLDDFQRFLLEQTFDNSLFSSFSIRMKYREMTLKTILKWLEDRQDSSTINDRWYELIGDLASRTTDDQEWCETVFFLTNGEHVIHRQTTALLSHGLTGLSNWPASVVLADFLMSNTDILSNKRIVELGSGSGLLGLSLLKYSPTISHYKFTDYSPMILNLLQQNLSLNFTHENLDKIDCQILNWNDPTIDNERPFDLILATDVVYDPSVIDGLVQTIELFLENNSAATALIANAIRNATTYELFQEFLRKNKFNIESIYYDQTQSIEILRIRIDV